MEILVSNFRSQFLNPQLNSIQIRDIYCLHMFITAGVLVSEVMLWIDLLLSVLKLYVNGPFLPQS